MVYEGPRRHPGWGTCLLRRSNDRMPSHSGPTAPTPPHPQPPTLPGWRQHPHTSTSAHGGTAAECCSQEWKGDLAKNGQHLKKLDEVKRAIATKDWTMLHNNDELRREMRTGTIFAGYTDCLRFDGSMIPTFKVWPKTHARDASCWCHPRLV